MILSNLTIPLLGLVDTAVMGHMSDAWYLGGIALGALIFSFVYWGFGFLRMGTTGLTAQALGQQNANELRATLARAVILALSLSLVLLFLQTPVRDLSLWLLDASNEVENAAAAYFDVRIWSAPATLINYVFIGWFLGMQNARAPLYLLVLINATNIVLDLFFVFVLDMGVQGVALASVIAEYAGVVLALYLVHKQLQHGQGQWLHAAIFNLAQFRRLLILNQNIFIRTLCLIFSFAFFTAQGAKHGDVILAANAVLMNFQTFMAYGLDGVAHAAEALVGKAMGEKNRAAYRQAVITAGFWSLIVAAIFMLIYLLFGTQVINALTDIETVRQTAYEYLPWLIISPIVSVWSYLYDGVFIGATRSTEMRNTMLLSTFCFFLPAWYLLLPWDNHGLWAALLIFMLARGITMAINHQRFTL